MSASSKVLKRVKPMVNFTMKSLIDDAAMGDLWGDDDPINLRTEIVEKLEVGCSLYYSKHGGNKNEYVIIVVFNDGSAVVDIENRSKFQLMWGSWDDKNQTISVNGIGVVNIKGMILNKLKFI